MIRRAILINGLIFIGVGLALLTSVYFRIADIPLIIVALLIVGIAAPLQFSKFFNFHGVVEEIYGPKYWIKFSIAMSASIIGTLFIVGKFPVSDIGVFVTSMGLASIMMAFVNPTYIPQDIPSENRWDEAANFRGEDEIEH